ncbi:dirigent protein 21 [Brachypodium distachyon]|uniref:Dirigent protein n=1 Tax=Brachypodium distachyon TaxID=15368 RepID=I1IN19_BRADI|nr:dirigent protein 21 [Brachypodium distachyon]KQJ89194.1 hypothetical protein BRADI_4g24110v3 [Brachypodium distachyon]|eukprot:XP_003577776.1 dirigent protein 21 [Brachypodium distachyon]
MAAKALLLVLFTAATLLSPTPATAADSDGLTKFKVYFHDVLSGKSPTAIRIAQSPTTNSSSTFFGAMVAIDDPLTTTPAATGSPAKSKDEVGRAQGSYTFADQTTFGLLMSMNFVFTAGDHKGSSLAIYGRNEVLSTVREMSVVGGTGKFRMARGYVEARTVDSGNTSGETVVEYTVFVKTAAGGAA